MLACGTGGKNITTDNISVRHLLNIHRIARRKVCRYIKESFIENYRDERLDAESLLKNIEQRDEYDEKND